MIKRIAASAVALSLVATGSVAANAADTAPVYMETVATGATLKVLATVGDKIGNYTLPAIPDGTGIYQDKTGLKLLMNHEYGATLATGARGNGSVSGGSTISSFSLDATNQTVLGASEFLKSVSWYNYQTKKFGKTPTAPQGAVMTDSYGTTNHNNALNRFCSASYAAAGLFSAKVGNKTYGYTGGVFLTGEEGNEESRGFAFNTKGEGVQLPRLGLAATETFVTVPTGNLVTAVLGNEDGAAVDSQLRMYVGKKTNKGLWYEKAGLNNGKQFVLKVENAADDNAFRSNYGKGKAASASFEELDWNVGGTTQNTWAKSVGTGFSRIEDGQFDPTNPSVYYFVTTESNKDAKATSLNPDDKSVTKRDGGALWKFTFTDVQNPLKGGSLEMLLDGSEAPYLNKPDNITVDGSGHILIQEDPGNNDQVSRLFAYDIATKKIAVIAKFKDEYFAATGKSKMTIDEESSGVIDVTKYFKKDASDTKSYYIYNAQVHTLTSTTRPDITDAAAKAELDKLFEGGQLYLLTVDDWSKVSFK